MRPQVREPGTSRAPMGVFNLSVDLKRSVALLLLGVATTTAAYAEAPVTPPNSALADTLEEVIVTAQKRAENLQEVPIAITVATADQLQAANVISAKDLPLLVSGLSIGDTANYFAPHLRGVGTAAFGPNVGRPPSRKTTTAMRPYSVSANEPNQPSRTPSFEQVPVLPSTGS